MLCCIPPADSQSPTSLRRLKKGVTPRKIFSAKKNKKMHFFRCQKRPNVLCETDIFDKKRPRHPRLESPQKSNFEPILGPKIGTFGVIFEVIFRSTFWSPFGALLGSVLGSILAPDGPKKEEGRKMCPRGPSRAPKTQIVPFSKTSKNLTFL